MQVGDPIPLIESILESIDLYSSGSLISKIYL